MMMTEFLGMLGYLALYIFVFSGLGYMLAKIKNNSKQTVRDETVV